MPIQILSSFDKNTIYCAGSLTKLLTTYVCLSKLAEAYPLPTCVDDENFLDQLCQTLKAQQFLKLFQKKLGGKFSIRDLCSYYSGLPYTFDLAADELENVELGYPFKHHSILDEKTFWDRCQHQVTPVYKPECKFHYSEVAIIFLGYLIENIYDLKIETLYEQYLIKKFNLRSSTFSRIMVPNVFVEDLSDKYDYPAIAILDHGYFCYSNGFYTTLNDMQTLLEALLLEPTFQVMTDISKARAASNRLLNGLTIEIRLINDDIVYGYEGLSFSGCTLWAYSTKYKQGYLTHSESEEEIYKTIYEDQWGYANFDKVPAHTEVLYKQFMQNYDFNLIQEKPIPHEFKGDYQCVPINTKILKGHFSLEDHAMVIMNPDEIKYDVIWINGNYRIRCKDKVHGARIGLYQAKSGNKYFLYDGTLYKKI